MMMGDTGAGKSVLQRRVLMQIAERGETAIVYDPALEYTPQFFNPERGDLILNPLDARCPYWSPCDEVIHEAEALTLATSLFPDKPHENTFFVEGPRKIFAHLLTLKPTPEKLAGGPAFRAFCEGRGCSEITAEQRFVVVICAHTLGPETYGYHACHVACTSINTVEHAWADAGPRCSKIPSGHSTPSVV